MQFIANVIICLVCLIMKQNKLVMYSFQSAVGARKVRLGSQLLDTVVAQF